MRTIIYFFTLSIILLLNVACKRDDVEPMNTTESTLDTIPTSNKVSVLKINLSGLESTNGKICVALYNSSASFNDPKNAYKELFITVTSKTMVIYIDNIPSGNYAFAIFHDENNNMELDLNLISIPKEGFAFSNNAMGSFGPPSWDQSFFSLPEKSILTQNIELKHF